MTSKAGLPEADAYRQRQEVIYESKAQHLSAACSPKAVQHCLCFCCQLLQCCSLQTYHRDEHTILVSQ